MTDDLALHFDFKEPDDRLIWTNPPLSATYGKAGLTVEPAAKSDYWSRTHYPGYIADSAHFLHAKIKGDFVLETSVAFQHHTRFDQFGLVVRLSPACWVKTSIEYDPPGLPKLGAVVTSFGYSDWSSTSVAQDIKSQDIRIRKEGPDVIVESRLPGEAEWSQVRVAHLHDDNPGLPVQAGLYAAAPIGAGGRGVFKFLSITPGRAKDAAEVPDM